MIMKISIIGLGNIGGMLAKRFAEILSPSNIMVFDTHKVKNGMYSRVNSSQEVIDKSEVIFVCIRPQNLNKFFWEMDNKYYTELEGKSDDMKKLVEYLNKIEV